MEGTKNQKAVKPHSPQGAFRPPSVKQLPSINSGHMPQLLGGVSQLQSLEGKINKKVFDKPITGDIFGSFMSGNQSFVDSLMYRARLTKNRADTDSGNEVKPEDVSHIETAMSAFEAIDSESDADNELKLLKSMNPKQQLALTIKNWSDLPENDQDIINEGAVYALIALCSVEDSSIRRCCATSFFHLSSRDPNREPLLNMGVTTGVVTLAMQARNWKVAKLCAMTLCNLSMQSNGEAIMAREGAILALVVLLGARGQSLLPICVQALYNITCTDEHFKGIERISKALLSISSSGFDFSDLLVKTLVNCSRYSWMRLRIIEDGAVGSLSALLPSLATRENSKELVFHMLVVLRSLSDSSGCRGELLQKGAVDILNSLLQYCDEKGILILLKIMHNFLRKPSAFSDAHFDTAVTMVNSITLTTTSVINLQYCAACMQIFTKEKIRGMKQLAVHVVDAMVLLLQSSDNIIQFYVITTCGDIFLNNLCADPVKVEQLIAQFIQQSSQVTEPQSMQALALAMAKLTQVESYMQIMIHLDLLRVVFDLLFSVLGVADNNLLLQESCCIAICRIALKLDDVDDQDRIRIAQIFTVMLDLDDEFVLSSTISSIRVLCSSDLCSKQFLSATLLNRIATIVSRYKNKIDLCRTGCAVLAVFSCDVEAHDFLAAENIMQVLFYNIKAEDNFIKELVATTLCNISTNSNAGNVMSAMGVVEVLATLSNSTSEVILELCAKCICNLTSKVDLHPNMIKSKILDIILMISLVRSVTDSTRLICAKALLNLITDANLPTIKESGAVRVFATLSGLPNAPIQFICAKGFYLLSITASRREELVQRRTILQSLFNMVKCQSTRIRVQVGITICNLLACSATNKAAIKAGALSAIKILSTMDFEELREATARVIINMAMDPALHKSLLREPIVPILVLILHQSDGFTFECAIFALSCLSHHDQFKPILIDKGLPAIISIILAGKLFSPNVANEACRMICNVSYLFSEAQAMVASGHLTLAMRAIYHGGICTTDSSVLLVLAMRNMSQLTAARKYLIDQSAFLLLVEIIRDFSHNKFHCSIIYSAAITMVYNLSLDHDLHESLLSQGLMEVLQRICLQFEKTQKLQRQLSLGPLTKQMSYNSGDSQFKLLRSTRKNSVVIHAVAPAELAVKFTQLEVDLISRTINVLSLSQDCHEMIVSGEVMRIFRALIAGLSDVSRAEMASALANLTSSKDCRETLVNQSCTELLIALSITSDSNTQAQCTLALGYLSELTKVKNGVVASMLLLSLNLEENISSNSDINKFLNVKGSSSADKADTERGRLRLVSKKIAAQVKVSNAINSPHGDSVKPDQDQAQGSKVRIASGRSVKASKVTMEDDLSSVQSSSSSNRVHTLSAMIRDLMVDKRKFDHYIHQLQRSNQLNLSNNGFVNGGVVAAHALKSEDKRSSIISYASGDSGTSVENSRQSSSLARKVSAHQPASALQDGDVSTVDADDNSSVNTRHDDDGESVFEQDDQDDYKKINLDENNCHIIDAEESAAVESDYKSFLYETVVDQGSARHSEPSGMAVRQLMDLPLPGIPADRDLGGVTSQERLVQVPINTASLGKDCKPIASSNITNATPTTAAINSNAEEVQPSSLSQLKLQQDLGESGSSHKRSANSPLQASSRTSRKSLPEQRHSNTPLQGKSRKQ